MVIVEDSGGLGKKSSCAQWGRCVLKQISSIPEIPGADEETGDRYLR